MDLRYNLYKVLHCSNVISTLYKKSLPESWPSSWPSHLCVYSVVTRFTAMWTAVPLCIFSSFIFFVMEWLSFCVFCLVINFFVFPQHLLISSKQLQHQPPLGSLLNSRHTKKSVRLKNKVDAFYSRNRTIHPKPLPLVAMELKMYLTTNRLF